jgi:lipoate-protein ligase A
MNLLFSTSTSPTFNLAAEEYLFSERQDDLLFLYVNDSSVIIGCNQAIRNEVDLEFCVINNVQVVRRISGGGAVYHDNGNLNFCFISNKTEGKSSLNDNFLQPIVEVLVGLGIPVKIGKRKDLWLPDGFKISGTASHIVKTRELHHGTLLYDTDLEKLQKVLTPNLFDYTLKAIVSVPSPVKNIRTWLQERVDNVHDTIDFFELLKTKLQQFYLIAKTSSLSDEDITKITQLQKSKFESSEWTFKK